jgi:gliding motility-associated-like protein
MKKYYSILLSLILLPFVSFGTHLRAGEITAKRISSTTLTYRITLTTYTDQINGKPANDGQGFVNFYFGFSTNKVEAFKVSRKGNPTVISPSTMLNVYDTTFTFPAPGKYTISCGIVNRNDNTVNLPQPSNNISFFVQSTILISASFGLNSTPVLLNIPIDSAAVGQKFIHNPGAFDIDGDSLSYKLSIPQKDKGQETGFGEFITGYKDPSTIGPTNTDGTISPILNEAKTGPATFRIDPLTGDLIWDCPRLLGQYNVAFIIEEWRKAPDGTYIKIGEIVRDMQIIVVASDNNRPEIIVPKDICVEAGKKVSFDIVGKDKDNQNLTLTSNGGVYNIDQTNKFFKFIEPEAAKFTATIKKSPNTGVFTWSTNCLHVRDQAYDVLFKVEDNPGRFNTQLVDIKTVKIKVVPPSPLGLVATEKNSQINLTWKPQTECKSSGKILVYRKSGCSGLNSGECTQGMPAAWNYVLIGTVTAADSTFIDKTAEKGAIYSYRLISQVQPNQFLSIQSAPSSEFCIGSEIKSGMTVLTNVTVDETDATNGKITVKWTRPIKFNQEAFAGPYVYKLYRTKGLGGENYELIHTQPTVLGLSADTVFIDKTLNTKDLVYKYKLELYTETTKLYGTTAAASAVRLSASPDDKSVKISWEANVPWSNDGQTHLIFRENKAKPGTFNLIKKVTVTNASSFNYIDLGKDLETADGDVSLDIKNGETYCYKVSTIGKYEILPALGLLSNSSQIICISPADKTPPCPPILTATNVGCESATKKDFCLESTFINKLKWENPTNANGATCRNDIVSYKIYYGRYDIIEPTLISVQDAALGNSFNHKRNAKDGFAGCYYITAVSSLNVESKVSTKICFDNCENIGFPNVFTPNNDDVNDTFSPLNCPAFIKNITYTIYSKNGLKVAEGSGGNMNWNGKTNDGKELPGGVYYYTITVDFEKLSQAGSKKTFKGYVSLIR